MSDWRVTTLDNLVRLQRGHDLPTSVRRAGDVPVVGAAGPSGFHEEACAKGPGVVLGRAGASMGHATYCPYDFWPLNTSLYVTDFLGNDPRFVYYLLSQIDFSGFNSGAAQPMLNRNYIKQIPIKLPRPEEQRRISACLGALDDKIAVNDRIARTCRELGQVIFDSKVIESRVAIQDVCAIVMGQSPPGDSYNHTGDGLPFYQGTRDFGLHLPQRRVWSTAVTRHAATGDVLVSVRAPVGAVNVASEPCGIGRGLAALRAHTYPHTLHHALMADSAAWTPFEGEGTVFSSINKKQLHTLRVRWPESGDEARLEPDLRVLDERLIAALVENQTLTRLRDTLLPELMSGRLRVRDAEKVVEESV